MRVTGRRSSRASQVWISASRASFSDMLRVVGFRPARRRRAIIMPRDMLRLTLPPLLVASLLCMMPVAHADDPPCASQIAAGSPPANIVPGVADKSEPAKPSDGGKFDVHADSVGGNLLEGKATLQGNVEVRQGDKLIRTDQAQLDRANGVVQSDGHFDYTDPLVHATGASGRYSQSAGADFHDADFSLRQRPGRGSAKDMTLTSKGVVKLKGVTFTTCPLNDSSWQLKADSIVLDTHAKIGTGRDAQVEFMGVPLLYLPWVSFPLSSERKSGFLFPTIGTTSYAGVQLSTPYYFNIAPNLDFTFEPTAYSRSGMDLGGDLRFLTENQHGELDWNYLPDDRQFGGSRDRVRFNDVIDLPDYWRLGLKAEQVSDPFYFEEFSQGPEGASTAFLERNARFSYRDEHWRVDAEAQQFQTIDYTLSVEEPLYAANNRPYARVPAISVLSDYTLGPGGIFHYGFDSELVDFQRPGGILEVQRLARRRDPGDLARSYRARVISCAPPSPGAPPSTSSTTPAAAGATHPRERCRWAASTPGSSSSARAARTTSASSPSSRACSI